MDEQRRDDSRAQYDETVHPDNPPSTMLRKDTRHRVVWSYFVPVVVLFVVVAGGLIYWAARSDSRIAAPERDQIGTVGSTEGGFDPQDTIRPGTTSEELERRGSDLLPITTLGELDDLNANLAAGRRVSLSDVEVDSVAGAVLWVHDGDARYAVVTDGDAGITKGTKVDVTGRIEPNGSGGLQVRADRVSAH